MRVEQLPYLGDGLGRTSADRVRVDSQTTGASRGHALPGNRTAPLKPKPGLSGPPVGAPVNLAEWGLGGAFENSQSVESAVGAFEASIVAQGSGLAATLCAGNRGRQTAVFTSDGRTVTNVTSVPCLYSVGHSTFFERATSTLDADCCGHKYTIRSLEHYFIRDKFTDPLLDQELLGMRFDLPFSQPYAINYDFYRVKIYDGTF